LDWFHPKRDETQRFPKQDPKVLVVKLGGQSTSLTQEFVQDFITTAPGFAKTLCLEGVPDSLDGHGGWVDRIMDPPCSVVIPEMVV
jgi:hypothetical protein